MKNLNLIFILNLNLIFNTNDSKYIKLFFTSYNILTL